MQIEITIKDGKFSHIRDFAKFINTIPDWSFINESLPGKARVGDGDGLLERNGYLLMLETKSYGATVPTGQDIMFRRLAERRKATILVLFGQDDVYTHFNLYVEGGDYVVGFCTNDTINAFIKDWRAWAEQDAAYALPTKRLSQRATA